MESKFENITGHAALSQKVNNSDANDCVGTVYWTYNKTNEDGTSEWPGEETSRDLTYESFSPDNAVETICENHQTLSVSPHINNVARREFQNQEYKVRKFMAAGSVIHGWSGFVRVPRMKRVIVQIED